MPFDIDTLDYVFEKSQRKCHYCCKQLAWKNYGRRDLRSGWEVDHSVPRSKEGTDHLNNLVASCWMCNLDKRDVSGNRYRKATQPLRAERKRKKTQKAVNEVLQSAAVVSLIAVVARIFLRRLNNPPETDHDPRL